MAQPSRVMLPGDGDSVEGGRPCEIKKRNYIMDNGMIDKVFLLLPSRIWCEKWGHKKPHEIPTATTSWEAEEIPIAVGPSPVSRDDRVPRIQGLSRCNSETSTGEARHHWGDSGMLLVVPDSSPGRIHTQTHDSQVTCQTSHERGACRARDHNKDDNAEGLQERPRGVGCKSTRTIGSNAS